MTPPAVVSAQVWFNAAETAATPLLSPLTSTGVVRVVNVPSPSAPKRLSPQHLRPPAVATAQVWEAAAETEAALAAEAGCASVARKAAATIRARTARRDKSARLLAEFPI